MYHDQALIPAKTLSFSETVNVTLGLAFVRTSPDHGTAFDLAGSGKADPSSLAAALRLAAELVANERARMSAIDDLPPLREVIARYRLSAVKGLGQNFLLDLNLTARIARAAGDLAGVTVIEVGPGPGGLTRALLATGARKVVAIERDERCLPALGEIAERYPGRLDIVHDDALDRRFRRALPTARRGSSPTSPTTSPRRFSSGWLRAEPWPPFYESMTLMFQREVAERIVAAPGSKSYGRLGVLAGWRSEARILFNVPAAAFTPPPKVMSSVVGFVPKPSPLPADPAVLERVVAAAFGQRRKMLRQSLRSLGVDPAPLLAAAGIEETRRAEEIDVRGLRRARQRIRGRADAEPRAAYSASSRATCSSSAGLTSALLAFGAEDGAGHRQRLLQVLVDDDVFVLAPVADLEPGIGEAPADHIGAVLGATLQPGAKLGHRRREHEDADDVVRQRFGDLAGSLPVDVEEHVATRRERRLDRLARRGVEVAVHLGPFEQLAAVAHRGEAAGIDEMIMDALDLARPPRPGRHRDRERKVGLVLEEQPAKRRLPGAEGDESTSIRPRRARIGRHRRYSRFWICSRS